MANYTIGGKGNPKYRHGMVGTRLYRIWKSMMTRATNRNRPQARDYILRGVGVCDEWRDFAAFMKWATTHGYDDTLTIDRMDNDKGYCPENCRWITIQQQQSNRRSNHSITLEGVLYATLKDAAAKYGIDYRIFQGRIYRGWPLDRILATPAKRRKQ